MSLCNTRCIFLTSSSHFRPLPPRIFTAVDDDGEDLEVSNDDNVDVDDVCDDGDCEGFGNDACVDKLDCDGECNAFELEFVDDNCVDNVRPCLAEQSDFDDVNDDAPLDDDDSVVNDESFDADGRITSDIGNADDNDVGNGVCDDKSTDDDGCGDKSLDAFLPHDVSDGDHMYVCMEGRSGCTVVNDVDDDTVPGSQLVTVDTCASCIDDDGFDDNDLVDLSFVDVGVNDVNVVCEDGSFNDDDNCRDT